MKTLCLSTLSFDFLFARRTRRTPETEKLAAKKHNPPSLGSFGAAGRRIIFYRRWTGERKWGPNFNHRCPPMHTDTEEFFAA
jgi:hypothetical protein